METVTPLDVAKAWNESHGLVREFLKETATPLYRFKSGRGEMRIYARSVLTMHDLFKANRKPPVNIVALGVKGRAAKKAKRISLEQEVRNLTARIVLLEKAAAAPSNGEDRHGREFTYPALPG